MIGGLGRLRPGVGDDPAQQVLEGDEPRVDAHIEEAEEDGPHPQGTVPVAWVTDRMARLMTL